MPTVFTHGIVGLTSSYAFSPEGLTQNRKTRLIFIGLSVALPIVPDLDGLFLPIIPYAHPLGHRGLSHSIAFAIFLGAIAATIMVKQSGVVKTRWKWFFGYFSTIVASHGLLDAMTSGGLGIAFFAPIDNSRYFFPIRPILAAPIWPSQFLTRYGARVLLVEILLIWTLCAALLVTQRKFHSVTLPLGGGLTRLLRLLDACHKPVAFVLLVLAAVVWVIRIV